MDSIINNIIGGFTLGLTTGIFCFTACVPVLLSVTMAESKNSGKSTMWYFVGKFLAGRFVAYSLLGLLAGLLGASMGRLSHQIIAYAWVILSATLIAYGLGLKLPRTGICEKLNIKVGKQLFPFILGGLTGINVCPPILLAFTYVLEKSVHPVTGVLVFISFFLATALFIIPVGFTGYLHRFNIVSTLGRVASVIVGIIFLRQGVALLW